MVYEENSKQIFYEQLNEAISRPGRKNKTAGAMPPAVYVL